MYVYCRDIIIVVCNTQYAYALFDHNRILKSIKLVEWTHLFVSKGHKRYNEGHNCIFWEHIKLHSNLEIMNSSKNMLVKSRVLILNWWCRVVKCIIYDLYIFFVIWPGENQSILLYTVFNILRFWVYNIFLKFHGGQIFLQILERFCWGITFKFAIGNGHF